MLRKVLVDETVIQSYSMWYIRIYIYTFYLYRPWLGQVIKDRHHCMQIYWLVDVWCLSICGGKQDWNAQRTYLMARLHMYIIAWYHIISFHTPWYQFLAVTSALNWINISIYIYTVRMCVMCMYVLPPIYPTPVAPFSSRSPVLHWSGILRLQGVGRTRRDVLNWSRNACCRWELWKR